MFQRQVASTDSGTWLGPQSSTQGHTVLLSCRVPALKQGHSTARSWAKAGLEGLLASQCSSVWLPKLPVGFMRLSSL